MLRARLTALVVFVGAGCIDPTIPAGALITCDDDTGCPDGFVCQDGRGRCVPQATLDETPPRLEGAAAVTPARGTIGTVFSLAFAVSEPLARAPEVVVDIGGSEARFVLDEDASDGDAFVFTYTATGAEVTERPSPIAIRLVDASENTSADLSGGVLTFDFSAPALIGAPTLSDTLLGPGDTLGVSFTATEALAAVGDEPAAAFTLVPAAGGAAIALVDDGAGGFRYTVAGTEPDGDYALVARLTDTSGNTARELLAGRVVIDVTAPLVQTGATLRTLPDVELRGDALLDARADSTLEVAFVASEPLAADPRVFVSCGGSERDLARVGDVTSRIVFVAQLTGLAGLPEGGCDVRADLVDDAGNEAVGATVLSPGFALDTTAPVAVDVDTEDSVVYRRVPWGADATGGARSFSLDGAGGAVEPFARVVVYERADAPARDALARADADADGAFALALAPVDRAEVFVAQVDPAGNESPRARVRDVEWVATMGGKVPGSSFLNPHRFESRAILTANLAQGAVVELGDQTATLDDAVVTTRGAATWEDVTERHGHPEVELPAAAFDPIRGRLVLVGGSSCRCGGFSTGPCIDTWERRGARWTLPSLADPEGDGNPPAVDGAAMVFDVSRGVVAFFPGNGEVWENDASSWRRVCDGACAAAGPSLRRRFAAAYDPLRRRTVLFGGVAQGALSAETWEWDGRSWQRACEDASCVPPPARSAHAMAYDDVHERVVLFGGDVVGTFETATDGQDDGGRVADLWAFDGRQWTELCTDAACAATRPSPRSDTAVAFDKVRGALVLHGGMGTPDDSCTVDPGNGQRATLLDDTFVFDGARFTQVTPADLESDGNPGRRRRHAMVWDPRRERVVLVGGVDTEPCFSTGCEHPTVTNTWEWDGASWRLFGAVAPQPVDATQLTAAFLPATEEVLVIGAAGGGIFRFGERWRQAGSFPRVEASVATSGTTVVATGGVDGGVGSFTGFATDGNFFPLICFFPPCPALPPARAHHASAEAPLGGMMLFGGSSGPDGFDGEPLSDTWTFDGAWREECPGCTDGASRPAPRFSAAMAFDRDRGVDVLFAGQPGGFPIPLGDTWEWDGARWVERAPSTSPPARTDHTLVYDEARRRTILFGGFASGFFGVNCGDGRSECADLWEYDGQTWSRPALADVEGDANPGARFTHAMAFSPRLQRSVMTGGGANDTWLFDGGGHGRPGQVMGAVFAAAGTAGDEAIRDVEARFTSGGSGDNDGAGARLFVWDVDGWRALADNAAPSTTPAGVTWRHADAPLADGDVLQRLFVGPERTLFFAVAPARENGGRPGFGAVVTDAAEITVRYRLP